MNNPIFEPGQKVKDLKYPDREGGTIKSVTPYAILVEMTYENGSVGLSTFKPEVAAAELQIVE